MDFHIDHIGDTVRYVGRRLPYNVGKLAEIVGTLKRTVGTQVKFGYWLRYEDGKVGTATPDALELVRRG